MTVLGKGVAGWLGTIPQFVDADRKVVRKSIGELHRRCRVLSDSCLEGVHTNDANRSVLHSRKFRATQEL